MIKKIVSILFFVVAVFGVGGSAQVPGCRKASPASAYAIECANVRVEFAPLKVRKLRGAVENGPSKVLIAVYRIGKADFKKNTSELTFDYTKWEIFETDKKHRFCLNKYIAGYYVLKFGTHDGGWNCTWIKVFVSPKNKDRPISVGLEIGI